MDSLSNTYRTLGWLACNIRLTYSSSLDAQDLGTGTDQIGLLWQEWVP